MLNSELDTKSSYYQAYHKISGTMYRVSPYTT